MSTEIEHSIFENSLDRLKTVGLISLVGDNGLLVGNAGCALVEDGMEFVTDDADICNITFKDGKWLMIHAEGIPTFIEEDCVCEFDTLGQAVDAVINYHLGQPEIIDTWRIPTHQHPEWSKDSLTSVISQAKQISSKEWGKLRGKFHKQEGDLIESVNSGKQVGDNAFEATQLISAPHESNQDQTLWIRRDLAEAFIVSKTQNDFAALPEE